MKILLAGGSGFLGRPLRTALAARGDDVVVLTRGPSRTDESGRYVTWDPDRGSSPGHWADELHDADVVVNMAGEGIADRRWTRTRKRALRESRLSSTRALISAMRAATRRPRVFISGSAIGYYGDTGDRMVDESFGPGADFLATLCVEWEAEAHAAESLDCRVVIVRTGVVLAAGGGALKQLMLPFSFFAGGPIASGRQYVSWIHRRDWVRLVVWTIDRGEIAGAVNATAPNPVTNAALAAAIGRAMRRPTWLRVPAFALDIVVGEMARIALVSGQRVLPRRAIDAGFTFEHPEINEAIAAALSAGQSPFID
jgi:uncharacterized protein (TIGR01777 family)